MKKILIAAVILFTTVSLFSSCHSEKPDRKDKTIPKASGEVNRNNTQQSTSELPEYVRIQATMNTLGVGDIIEVKVLGENELSGKYEVFSDGTILFPLIGKINVASLDPNQVAEIIRSRLADGFLKDPQVSIFVTERKSKKIFVFGEVKKPGTFMYEESMSVIQAITLAEGFTDRASRNETSITRVVNGKEQRIVAPVEKIGKGEIENIILKPGDIVYIPESIF